MQDMDESERMKKNILMKFSITIHNTVNLCQ